MKAEIITIGDELLIGQVIDTNSAWLAIELNKLGIDVKYKISVGDDELEIINVLADAQKRSDIVFITGGLGPTKDDITKKTLCNFFGTKLIQHQETLNLITQIFSSRNLPMLESNINQSMIPANCLPLLNKAGTAPGMWFEKDQKIFISLPGVPFEMKTIFESEVAEKLKNKISNTFIHHQSIQTISIGESFLAKKIEDIEDKLPPHIKLAYLPSLGIVKLRLSAKGNNKENLVAEVDSYKTELIKRIGKNVFSESDDPIEKIIGDILKEKNKTICTAESCTGGYIAHRITLIPGSSSYFKGGIVSYANEVKTQELKVGKDTIEKFGAVSKECVEIMACEARKKFKTDYAIACSGVAGPDGGTTAKPVGTIWIAIASQNTISSKVFAFGNIREINIQRTALAAFDMLRGELKQLN